MEEVPYLPIELLCDSDEFEFELGSEIRVNGNGCMRTFGNRPLFGDGTLAANLAAT